MHTTDTLAAGSISESRQHMLTPAQFGMIRNYDVCAIIDAIESLGVRFHNEGYTRPGLRCQTLCQPRLLGYASTFQVRSSNPPARGGTFLEQTDWWPDQTAAPIPRIAILQDLEPHTLAACMGEAHSDLLRGLGYHGVITNGVVRDLPAVRNMRSAYTHIVSHGHPVEIMGLKIHEGDLLYADCHGVVNIPAEIAGKVAEAASRVRAKEARIVQACLSAHISRAELREMIQKERM